MGQLCRLVLATSLVSGCSKEHAPTSLPPPTVSVAPAAAKNVPIYVEFAGTLDGYINADVRARVAGVLVSQSYREGGFVKLGDLLFTIDPAPFRAARLEARGALEQARAAFEKADADVARYRPLVEKRAATREQLENAIAARHSAEGQTQAARANLEQAELNLGYTRITAPVDGIAGIAEVRVGNLVGQGSPTLLTTVSNVDPIRFTFHIGESAYVEYAERLKQLAQGPPQAPNDPAHSVKLVLAGNRPYPSEGYIAVVGREVDPSTGTLMLQALFPNPERLLRPGQYGRLRFTDELKDAVVVPQRAVQSQQGQDQVAVIDDGGKAELRTVKLGPVTGSFVIIESGLKAGEKTVIDGLQKVRAGQLVSATPPTPRRSRCRRYPSRCSPLLPLPRPSAAGRPHHRAPLPPSSPIVQWASTSFIDPSWRSSSPCSRCSWGSPRC